MSPEGIQLPDVGYLEATFLWPLDSVPNPEFENLGDGCAVIQALFSLIR
jgi:hypothetical protein